MWLHQIACVLISFHWPLGIFSLYHSSYISNGTVLICTWLQLVSCSLSLKSLSHLLSLIPAYIIIFLSLIFLLSSLFFCQICTFSGKTHHLWNIMYFFIHIYIYIFGRGFFFFATCSLKIKFLWSSVL